LARWGGEEPIRRRTFILISLFAGVAGAAVLSAQITTKFRAERERIEEAIGRNQNAKGLTEGEILHNRLLNPFASSGVRIQKVLPGGSVAVTVRGDFPAGTMILSERDGVAISGAALSTTTYSARLTIPPDEGPGFVRLWGFTPLGIEGPIAVALVDTLYRFDLKSANGYTVKVAPVEKTFTFADNKYARVKYQAEFYKPGDAKPFQTVVGDETFDPDKAPYESHTPYARLDISFSYSTTSPQAEIEAITGKMNDPKTTAAERNDLLVRLVAIQQKMLEGLTKLQTDPASLDKEQDDFGCGLLQLYPSRGGAVEGVIICGKNFNDGALKVTGTMTQLR
jgi:hypothetical protein